MMAGIKYIQPADYGEGLRGLAGSFQRAGEMKRERAKQVEVEEEDKRIAETRKMATQAMESGDYVGLRNIVASNPSLIADYDKMIGWKSDITKKNALDFVAKAGQTEDPKQWDKLLTERIELIEKNGGDPTQTIEIQNELRNGNPEPLVKEAATLEAVYWEETLARKKALGGGDTKPQYAPSPLKKSINERQEYIDAGMSEDDPIMQAYDREITGVDKGALVFTPQQLDVMGVMFAKTGKMPSLGRGKESTRARLEIASKGAAYQLREEGFGEYVDKGVATGRTPIDAAMAAIGDQSDTKAIQGSLNFLDKQLSSMGSFVTNLNSQVGKVNELAKDLKTSNVRWLNIPIRKLRGKLKGSALQAKYDMYLTEIESEIGKLATGSTGSVSELSVGAQEKWSQIHDKNLSVKDMLSLLEETKKAANFRIESVQGQLNKTRERMRSENRDFKQEKSDPLGIR